jgi:para-aminobenzoate synthetase component 1
LELEKTPVERERFSNAFTYCKEEIEYGNSFLLNLTFPSEIKTNYTLEEIFHSARSSYKILWKDKFVSFSPECFVKIKDNKIYSYPMKGTIDASIENAKEKIINDKKEEAEHYTIVDLIRNDLSMVSKNVQVTKFRYLDEIKTPDKNLLQVSSEICGDLPEDWRADLGNIIMKLLPAGSISGAPKEKTRQIIQKAEQEKRGFYTGISGIFDGDTLDSCVLIRFIEKNGDKKFYRSGGGITFRSEEESEYNELIDKIYVPSF